MWEKIMLSIIEAVNTHYNPIEEEDEGLSSSPPTLSDAEVKREIDIKDRNLDKLHEIIGENPLNQIEYIIENGMVKHNEIFRKYEDRTLLQEPAQKLEVLQRQLMLLEEENVLKLNKCEPSVLAENQIKLLSNRTESLRQHWLKDEEGNDRVLVVAATSFSISFNQKHRNYSTQGLGDSFFMSREEVKDSSMFKVPEFFSHYKVEYWNEEHSKNRKINLESKLTQEKINKERESLALREKFNRDRLKNEEEHIKQISEHANLAGFTSSSSVGSIAVNQVADSYSSVNIGDNSVLVNGVLINGVLVNREHILAMSRSREGVFVVYSNGYQEFYKD